MHGASTDAVYEFLVKETDDQIEVTEKTEKAYDDEI